ncbi:MAG TPA: Mur ligase family protein [Candidatus Paceibacterota bacterium]
MKSIFKKIIIKILLFESRIILKKYKPKIATVTGNVGKTSTKDAIFTVLSSIHHIRKSEKSYNSEIGLPLTIIGCENAWNDPFLWLRNIFHGLELIIFKSNYPKCLVLEIGADHPGDIESISKWLKSDIVVMTKIGDVPVHVEFFSSPEELFKEKSYLIDSLKENGTLVLLADDKKVIGLLKNIKQKCITFGITEMAAITASDITVLYDDHHLPSGMGFRLNYAGNSIPIKVDGVLGSTHIYPLLAGTGVGISMEVSLPKIIESFSDHKPPRGRMNILAGIKGSAVVDDSYNSSPDALREGLVTLANLQVSGKRIAVLGDMLELGSFSAEEHRRAGIKALQSCDILITVGPRARLMSGKAVQFDSSFEAGEYVKSIIGQGDVVFVKGSQSIRMERTVKEIMAEPHRARELLVRQEEEWLNR